MSASRRKMESTNPLRPASLLFAASIGIVSVGTSRADAWNEGVNGRITAPEGTKVGIGTSDPGTTLDVVGGGISQRATSNSPYLNGVFRNLSTGNVAISMVDIGESSTGNIRAQYYGSGFATSEYNIAASGMLTTGANATGGMTMLVQANAPYRIFTNGQERYTLSGAGQHALRGPVTLSSTLEVSGTASISMSHASMPGLVVTNANSTSNLYAIQSFTPNVQGTAIWEFTNNTEASGTSSNGDAVFRLGITNEATRPYLNFAVRRRTPLESGSYAEITTSSGTTSGLSELRIQTGGGKLAVGGPVSMASTLTVAGALEVASVKTATWTVAPDYVFEKDYKLASLEEVDAFVKRNKHLPEVPSAKEFKAKGMDLAEMNFTLLKKVEELTLHAIRQEKEMKRQAAEMRKQAEVIRRLEGTR